MTAPFAAALCGYRADGVPSTADASDGGSKAWGHALLGALGVPPSQSAGTSVGDRLEHAAFDHLRALRPDLRFRRSAPSSDFEQYEHLGTFRKFQQDYRAPEMFLNEAITALHDLPGGLERSKVQQLIDRAQTEGDRNHSLVEALRRSMPQESLLKLDVTVGDPASPPRLLIAVSSKWSLRTDRAQDCIAQGQKLANLRRGHMPHYAVLTMEPRPTMLRLLAYGSGAVDCVYHVALPELIQAADHLVEHSTQRTRQSARAQRETLELMVEQRRIRDYDSLVTEVLHASV